MYVARMRGGAKGRQRLFLSSIHSVQPWVPYVSFLELRGINSAHNSMFNWSSLRQARPVALFVVASGRGGCPGLHWGDQSKSGVLHHLGRQLKHSFAAVFEELLARCRQVRAEQEILRRYCGVAGFRVPQARLDHAYSVEEFKTRPLRYIPWIECDSLGSDVAVQGRDVRSTVSLVPPHLNG